MLHTRYYAAAVRITKTFAFNPHYKYKHLVRPVPASKLTWNAKHFSLNPSVKYSLDVDIANQNHNSQSISTGSFFWDSYIPVYDKLRLLEPYQALLVDIVKQVRTDDGKPVCHVVDMGCGTGNVGGAILQQNKANKRNISVHGLDTSPEMLSQCSSKHPTMVLKQASMEQRLPYPDNFFDVAVCNNVLYLLQHPKQAVAEMYRIVRPGGKVIISTPSDQWKQYPIVYRHIQKNGFLSMLANAPSFLIVAIVNMYLGRNKSCTFYNKANLLDAVGHRCHLQTTYADTCFLACGTKSSDYTVRPAYPQSQDHLAARALVLQRYQAIHKIDKLDSGSAEGKQQNASVRRKTFVCKRTTDNQVIGSATVLWGAGSLPTEKYFQLERKHLLTEHIPDDSDKTLKFEPPKLAEIVQFAIGSDLSPREKQKALFGLFGAAFCLLDKEAIPLALCTHKPSMHRLLRGAGIPMTKVATAKDLDASNVEPHMRSYFLGGNSEDDLPMAVSIDPQSTYGAIFVDSPVLRTGQVSVIMTEEE